MFVKSEGPFWGFTASREVLRNLDRKTSLPLNFPSRESLKKLPNISGFLGGKQVTIEFMMLFWNLLQQTSFLQIFMQRFSQSTL